MDLLTNPLVFIILGINSTAVHSLLVLEPKIECHVVKRLKLDATAFATSSPWCLYLVRLVVVQALFFLLCYYRDYSSMAAGGEESIDPFCQDVVVVAFILLARSSLRRFTKRQIGLASARLYVLVVFVRAGRKKIRSTEKKSAVQRTVKLWCL